ncbi:MAG: restriction endonuclease subunit R, partial [Chlorobiales bacterium]|nr:restriction endonuclease subunit R [Chlorobiales bacterium]
RNSAFFAAEVKTLDFNDLAEQVEANRFAMQTGDLDDSGWMLVDTRTLGLLQKLRAAGVPLEEYVDGKIYRGVLTGLNEAFVIDEETKNKLISEDRKSEEIIKPFLAGRDIKRYEEPKSDKYLIFTRRGIDIEEYPAIKEHLLQFKEQLMPKPKNWNGKFWKGRKEGSYKWFEIQDSIDYYPEFEKPKIIYPNICKQPEFTFDENLLYTNQKCFIIPIPDKYLIGVLNSKVTMFLFQIILPKLRGDFFEPSYVYFKDFPIRKLDLTKKQEKAVHDKLVRLVNEMLKSKKELSATQLGYRKTQLESEIDALDRQIDALVYELYGLSEEEIALVEGKGA